MNNELSTWKELKAKFLRDFTAGEQLFFLKKARECVSSLGYPVSEDLFNYCYFLTIKERLGLIDTRGGEGLMRFMLVESRREIEAEIQALRNRLEQRRLPSTEVQGQRLLEYLARP